nr:HAD-IIA family hydrolase [Jiangella asiatica]
MQSLSQIYDVALLDLDGVVYVGAHPVRHAPQALWAARHAGMRLAFVTNNASRPPDVVAAHLAEIGVEALPAEVVTSAQAAARMLAERLPDGSKVLVVGGEGLEVALRERDLVPVATADDGPAAVVQGFSPRVGWPMLAEGTYAVAAGLLWVATNLDPVVPTDRGRAPGNGTLVDTIRTATGREPLVAGKPEPPMHREAMLRSNATRPLVVGDRLDTDVEGANAAGADSLLVLTGVTDPEEVVLAAAHLRPTYVGTDLRALREPPEHLTVRTGEARAGAWRAAVVDGALRLTRDAAPAESAMRDVAVGEVAVGEIVTESQAPADSGADGLAPLDPADQDALDALRAACGAVWAAADQAGGRVAGRTGDRPTVQAAGGRTDKAVGGADGAAAQYVDPASVRAALDAARIARGRASSY